MTVEYWRPDWASFEARAVCHETDHLDGVLYVDKMDRELTEEEIHGRVPEDDD